jgi:cytochrome c2
MLFIILTSCPGFIRKQGTPCKKARGRQSHPFSTSESKEKNNEEELKNEVSQGAYLFGCCCFCHDLDGKQ